MGENLNQEQAAPTDGIGPDCWELVLADMRDRRQMGIDKYGKPLRPDNGRDALVDAYQEVLDLTVYLRQAIEQQRAVEHRINEEILSKISAQNKILSNISDRSRCVDELRQARFRLLDLYEAVMAFQEWFVGQSFALLPPGMELVVRLAEVAEVVAKAEGFKPTAERQLQTGTKTRKVGGSYEATGEIRAVFATRAGLVRYVFEFDEPKGLLHIFNENQLEAAL